MGVVVTGLNQYRGKLAALGKDVRAAKMTAVRRASIEGRRFITDRMKDQPPRDPFLGKPPGRGGSITTRTGHTRSAITPGGIVVESGDLITSAVGSPDAHMKAIEDGGIIPAGSRIPLAAGQTPGGRDRLLGQRMTAAVRKAMGFFLYPTRAQRAGKGKADGSPWPKATYLVKAIGAGARRRLEFWAMYLPRAVRRRPRRIFHDATAKVNQTARRDLDGLVHAATVKANR